MINMFIVNMKKPILIILLLVVITSCLSSILYNKLLAGNKNYSSDSLNAVFGSTRTALSSYFYDKADLYFHRGISEGVAAHKHEEKAIAMHEDHEDNDHDVELQKTVFEPQNPIANFYTTMDVATVPSGHFHRTGEESKEILPWIYLAIKIDPTNDELYRTIAYWLDQGLGREDLSVQMLDLAQQNLPYNPSIKLEQGMIFLKNKDDVAALQKFEAALKFINLQPEDQQDPYLKANILLEIAGIYEKQGRTAEALESYQQIHQLFPERQSTINKIKALTE